MKIGTLKLSETIRNIRLGEGALGVALWKWKESRAEEIYVTIVDVKYIKRDGNANYTFEQFKEICGNKTIFTERELSVAYQSDNVVCLQMVYNGYFGKGNNVNYNKLKSMGCFETYPYQITYSHEQFEAILREGHVDIRNIYA